jgi:hypothetical protein
MEEDIDTQIFFDNLSDDVLISLCQSGDLEDLCIEISLESMLDRRKEYLC